MCFEPKEVGDIIGENPDQDINKRRKCYVMGGRKIKHLSRLKWPRSPSQNKRTKSVKKPKSERSSHGNSPSSTFVNQNQVTTNKDNNILKIKSPMSRTTILKTRSPKAPLTERAPRPACDDPAPSQFIQVDVELLATEKTEKERSIGRACNKKRKNNSNAIACSPNGGGGFSTPVQDMMMLADNPPPEAVHCLEPNGDGGDFTLMSSARKSANFAAANVQAALTKASNNNSH